MYVCNSLLLIVWTFVMIVGESPLNHMDNDDKYGYYPNLIEKARVKKIGVYTHCCNSIL